MRGVTSFGQNRLTGGVNVEDYKIDIADNEMASGTRNTVLTKRGVVRKRQGSSEVGIDANLNPVLGIQQYTEDSGTTHIHKLAGTKLYELVGSAWTDVKTGLTNNLSYAKALFYSVDGTAVTSGTATSGTDQTLVKTGAGWTVNAYKDKAVVITSGTGSGQVKYILSNTADTLTVYGRWDTNPDGTSQYSIQTIVKSAIYSNGTDKPFKVISTTATDLSATYPKFTECLVHLKRLFYIDPTNRKKIRWSDPFISDAMLNAGTQNYWDVEENVVALGRAGNSGLVIYTSTKTGILRGDEPDNFSFGWIDQKNGCIAKETVRTWGNYSLALSEQGVFRTDGLNNYRISRKIKPLLDAMPRTYRSKAEAIVFEDKYHLAYPSTSTSTYNDGMVVLDLIWSSKGVSENNEINGSWMPYEGLKASTFSQIIDSGNNIILYFGSSENSRVFRLYDGTYNDDGFPINWDVYTKGIVKGGFSRKTRLKQMFAVAEAQSDDYPISIEVDTDQTGFSYVGDIDTNVKGSAFDSAVFDSATFEGAEISVGIFNVGGYGRIIQFHFYNRLLDQPAAVYGWEQTYKLKTVK